MKKGIVLILCLLLCFSIALGCLSQAPKEGSEKEGLTRTAVMLDWTPNTNHTGLYVALEKGYFREEGLDLTILPSVEPGPAQLIAADKLDFGVSYQEEVTNARAAGIPIVSLAAVIQHNTSGFASLKEDGILRPHDLEGKRYGGWGSPQEEAVIEAIMKKDGGDPRTVEYVNVGEVDFFAVIGKQVDFAWIYQGWDGIQAQLRNIALNVIMLKDFAEELDYYTPVLITSEKIIAERPQLARAFIAAAARGYEFAIAHPEEAAEILLKHVPELNRELVRESQKWLAGQYKADAARWGEQKEEVWRRYADWMLEKGLLSKGIEAGKAFTNDFLPQLGS